jgi:uncharacterized membrane protein
MDAFWSLLMFLGSTLCHQLPERSYFFGSLQMPLCARCIGIHFGFLLSTAFLWTGSRRFTSGIPSLKHMGVLGVVMAFFLLDSTLSYGGISTSDNLRRTLSGLSLGVTFPFFVIPLLNSTIFPGRNTTQLFSKTSDWAWFAGLYGFAAAVILLSTRSEPQFYAVSIVGVTGIFFFFILTISLVFMLAFENSPYPKRLKLTGAGITAVTLLLTLALLHRWFIGTP